jgi:ribonuclease P protein component
MRFSFKKSEKLCSRKLIQKLFAGKPDSLFHHPIKFSWIEAEFTSPYPAQVMISVSKKNFPRAVDRNRVKRMIREIYRLHKHNIYKHLETKGRKYALSINYVGKTIMEYAELESRLKVIFERLTNPHEQAGP